MMYTNFQIFKNKYKQKDNQPDYKISTRDNDGMFIEIGAGWKKEMKNGEVYISCRLSENQYKPNTEEENERIIALKAQHQEKPLTNLKEEIPF